MANLTLSEELALCYLLGPERGDAFDGLQAVCWKAKRNLFVPGPRGSSVFATTRGWIAEWLMDFFTPYLVNPDKIDKAMRDREFRWLGRKCYLGMVDEIRRRKRKHRVRTVSLHQPICTTKDGDDFFLTQVLHADPTGGSEFPRPKNDEPYEPTPENRSAFLDFVHRHREVIERKHGKPFYRALGSRCGRRGT